MKASRFSGRAPTAATHGIFATRTFRPSVSWWSIICSGSMACTAFKLSCGIRSLRRLWKSTQHLAGAWRVPSPRNPKVRPGPGRCAVSPPPFALHYAPHDTLRPGCKASNSEYGASKDSRALWYALQRMGRTGGGSGYVLSFFLLWFSFPVCAETGCIVITPGGGGQACPEIT